MWGCSECNILGEPPSICCTWRSYSSSAIDSCCWPLLSTTSSVRLHCLCPGSHPWPLQAGSSCTKGCVCRLLSDSEGLPCVLSRSAIVRYFGRCDLPWWRSLLHLYSVWRRPLLPIPLSFGICYPCQWPPYDCLDSLARGVTTLGLPPVWPILWAGISLLADSSCSGSLVTPTFPTASRLWSWPSHCPSQGHSPVHAIPYRSSCLSSPPLSFLSVPCSCRSNRVNSQVVYWGVAGTGVESGDGCGVCGLHPAGDLDAGSSAHRCQCCLLQVSVLPQV